MEEFIQALLGFLFILFVLVTMSIGIDTIIKSINQTKKKDSDE
jgi:hypothetical protein